MKEEYDAIHQAGFLLQIDCPDLAMGKHIQFTELSLEEFRKSAELHVEALNQAVGRYSTGADALTFMLGQL